MAASSDAADDGARTPDDAALDAQDDFDRGDAPSPGSDAASLPPTPTPIRYLVVIVKENHTFDNYFYGFPGVSSPAPSHVTLTGGASLNLATQVAPFATFPYAGLAHTHERAHRVWHGGAMDRFDQDADGTVESDHASFYHYPETQIPSYWQYARHFVLADNFFSTTMGPSAPGHNSIVAGFSPAYDDEDPCTAGAAACALDPCAAGSPLTIPKYDPTTCETRDTSECFAAPTFVDIVPTWATWRVYTPNSVETPLDRFQAAYPLVASHHGLWDNAVRDFMDGEMANVSVFDMNTGPYSEHPPAHPCAGESFTVQLVNALMRGPHWNETAIVITWDDWGGWYDHAVPTVDPCPAPYAGEGYNTGFRLPMLLISPYARRGAAGDGLVFGTRTEQASITRLIGELFHTPGTPQHFLAEIDPRSRDQRANSLLGAFDFAQPPRAPLILTPRTDCPPTS